MTITVEKKETEQVEIPVPSFYRDKAEKNWVGILDEKTVVTLFIAKDLTIVTNQTPNYAAGNIKEAVASFHSCTETEFIEKYDQLIESISLHPKLTT